MNTSERDAIETVIGLCRDARERLHQSSPYRLRVLLDMALVELGKELARLKDSRAA